MLGKDPMKNKRKAKHNRAENTSDRHTDTEREREFIGEIQWRTCIPKARFKRNLSTEVLKKEI